MSRPARGAAYEAGIKLLGLSLVAGILLAGILLPVVGSAGWLASTGADGFQNGECDLPPDEPPQTSVIKAADGSTIATLYLQDRISIPAGEIPDVIRQAIVAIEDRRFYEHSGIDLRGTMRALLGNLLAGGVTAGGSTLTQQYVKNVLLYRAQTRDEEQAATEQTSSRKAREAVCALRLEEELSKDEILNRYLNLVNFGSGAYGIKKAAETYYGVQPRDLTISQAAMLAGVVNAPGSNPYVDPERAKNRRAQVIDDMLDMDFITPEQAEEAKNAPLVPPGRTKPTPTKDCANASDAIANPGFFCEYVKTYLRDVAGFSLQQLQSGGLQIVTTLDKKMQAAAQQAVDSQVGRDRRAVGVMDIVEPATGKVRAMAVSKTFGVDSTDVNQTSLPLATAPVVPPGSANKLFAFIAALQDKMPLRAFPITTQGGTYQPVNCGSDKPPVRNSSRTMPDTVNLEEAMYRSSNTAFQWVVDQRLGCDLTTTVQAAIDLGLHSVEERKNQIIRGKEISFPLGPEPQSVLEMAGAYAAMANDGVFCSPNPIEQILDPDGSELPLSHTECKRAVEVGIARTINQALVKDTDRNIAGNTGKEAALPGRQVAGKTGTNNQHGSVSFIGYTRNLAGAVAVFNPDGPSTPIDDVPGFQSGEVFGGRLSARIWRVAMEQILANAPIEAFPPEDPNVVNGDQIAVPSVVGRDMSSAQSILRSAGFSTRIDSAIDSDRPAGTVVNQSPNGGVAPEGTIITLVPSTGIPPQPSTPPTEVPPSEPGNPSIPPGNPGIPTFFPTPNPGGPGQGGGRNPNPGLPGDDG